MYLTVKAARENNNMGKGFIDKAEENRGTR